MSVPCGWLKIISFSIFPHLWLRCGIRWSHFFLWRSQKLFCDQRVVTFFFVTITKKMWPVTKLFVIARQPQFTTNLAIVYHRIPSSHLASSQHHHPTIKPINKADRLQPTKRINSAHQKLISSLTSASLLFCRSYWASWSDQPCHSHLTHHNMTATINLQHPFSLSESPWWWSQRSATTHTSIRGCLPESLWKVCR